MSEFSTFLPGILTAYSILFVAALSPGPSVLMLIGIATEQGRMPALTATLGIAIGSVSINILTMLGVGFVLSQFTWAMDILRIFGGAYLLYLAYGAFKKSYSPPPPLKWSHSSARSLAACFIKGYLLQVTNPKAIIFWLAIASVGAVDDADTGIKVIFVIGSFMISFLCHGLWATTMSSPPIRLFYNKTRRWVELLLGSFFTFSALKLVMSLA